MDKNPPIVPTIYIPTSMELYRNTGNCRTCGLLFDRENQKPTCDGYFRCKDCRGIKSIDCSSLCSIQ